MTRPIQEGDLLWQPSEQMTQSNMAQYMLWLELTKGVRLRDYTALWEWSITDLEAFWESYLGVLPGACFRATYDRTREANDAGSVLVSWC